MTLAYLQSRRIDCSCVATSAGIAMRLSEQAKWTAYPELFAVIGGKVPDYRSWFLRGGTAGQAGDEAQDSIRSHAHELTEHAHTLTIKDAASKDEVASMTPIYDTVDIGGISGVPMVKVNCEVRTIHSFLPSSYTLNYRCPQYGLYNYTSYDTITVFDSYSSVSRKILRCGLPIAIQFKPEAAFEISPITIGKEDVEYQSSIGINGMNFVCSATLQSQESGSPSSITYVSGMKMAPGSSAVSGTTDPGGAGQTRETGGAETAPKHKFVRYLIRARP